MVDVHNKKQRSYNMSRIKSRNTQPELSLRKNLFSKGFRGYRINLKIKGKPDLVFNKQKVAIFVDGCFWHKCPKCFIFPDTNNKFWSNKIKENIKRDKKINEELISDGWKVLRFWEHQIKKDINECTLIINKELKKRGE